MKKLSKTEIEKKYARALFDASLDANALDQVQKDMLLLEEIKNLNDIGSPLISKEKQLELIDLLQNKLSLCQTTANFLRLLAENHLLKRFNGISAQLNDMVLQHKDIQKVVVETVQPLSNRQQEKLLRGLKKKLKKDVVISYVLNENLLGGLILRIGSLEIDDSLKTKLKTLENIMKGLS